MKANAQVPLQAAERYSSLFVNRLACTLQSNRPGQWKALLLPTQGQPAVVFGDPLLAS